MSWPDWIEELKARYLGDEASVFLLHGAVASGRWVVDGQTIDCMTTLVQFLSQSREILGVLDPDRGLSFPGVGDRARFQALVRARRTLDGSTASLREDRPEECLALLHSALSASGRPQGYLLIYADKLFPEKKRPLPPLPAGTPPFASWIDDPVLRRSDNLVVLLAEELDAVHREIRQRLGRGLIEVPDEHPPVAVTREVTADVDLRGLPRSRALFEDDSDDITPIGTEAPPTLAELEAAGTRAGAPTAPAPEVTPAAPDDTAPDNTSDSALDDTSDSAAPHGVAPDGAALDDTSDGAADAAPDPLLAALYPALRRHPTGPWPGLLPVREALAQVVHSRAPERCGPLLFDLDDDGTVTAQGPGADWFQSWFDGGIVVRAASEQLLSKLFEVLDGAPVPQEGAIPLEEAKLRALRKQLDKALA